MNLADMSWPEVEKVAKISVALWPLAAIEQHGPHLAVSTDDALVTAIAERVERNLSREVVLCPTLPFGSSHHHLNFAGTMSLPADLYTETVVELVKSLIKTGFLRIVLLNGHGGNITPVRQALSLLSYALDDELQPNIALATYWELGGTAFAGDPPMESAALSHACEYETSMMLHLFPQLVHLDRARRAKAPVRNGYVPWEDDEPYRGVTMTKKTQYISSNGSSGRPDLASAAKGEHLLEKATAAVIEFVTQFKTWPLMTSLKA